MEGQVNILDEYGLVGDRLEAGRQVAVVHVRRPGDLYRTFCGRRITRSLSSPYDSWGRTCQVCASHEMTTYSCVAMT